MKFIVPNWCPNFYWLNFPDPRFPRNVKTYQHWAVVCYWLLCCLLTALNSKHSCLLMFSHFLVCLNNLTLICTIQVSSLFVLCNCCCFVPLHVPAMHLDLLLDTIQAELNSITKVTQKYLDKTRLILSFWACPAWSLTPLELENSSAACGWEQNSSKSAHWPELSWIH